MCSLLSFFFRLCLGRTTYCRRGIYEKKPVNKAFLGGKKQGLKKERSEIAASPDNLIPPSAIGFRATSKTLNLFVKNQCTP